MACFEVSQLKKSPLNNTASKNMACIIAIEAKEVATSPTGTLHLLENRENVLKHAIHSLTEEVSQLKRSSLKNRASKNMASISVTEEVVP